MESDEPGEGFLIGVSVGKSIGEVTGAFPWAIDISLHGSLPILFRLHGELGFVLGVMGVTDAKETGVLICSEGGCSNERETGFLLALPLGLSFHVPAGEDWLKLGAGGSYSGYKADTNRQTGWRWGPGFYGRFEWAFQGIWAAFLQFDAIFSSGDTIERRLPDHSADFWLSLGFRARFGG